MATDAVYGYVTERIVGLMEKGQIPWERPWKGHMGGAMRPANIVTGRPYNGCNYFLLSILGFSSPFFMTFKQIEKLGGKIKAGEEKRHAPVYYWKWLEGEDKVTGKVRKFPMLRYFLVWNLDQVEGVKVPAKFQPNETENEDTAAFSPIEAAEAIVSGYAKAPPMIENKVQNRACYIPSRDAIEMPAKEAFKDVNHYYSTLFHEMGHSTGHATRLNRKELMDASFFGSHNYSQEELTAELTAAFLAAECGINNEDTERNTAAYIQSWIKRLKSEPKWFMIAAGRAQKAADLILGRQQTEEVSE